MMQVSQRRLREDIEHNGEFGAIDVEEGHGRTVLTGSEADRQAREFFVERMEELGMDVRVDPVGTIYGQWTPATADSDAAPVVVGSHLDSVPEGGIFDGPLGVYGGLEAVRTVRESDAKPTRPLGVVAFTEEEGGRFDVGLLGSSVATGQRSVEDALALEDDDGTTLEEYLESIGFRGEDDIAPGTWDAFFEIHIEQGKRLEAAGVPAGVVTVINGLINCEVHIEGRADHASILMDDRSDAMAAASEFVLDVEAAARELTLTDSDTAVATVGKVNVEPNARNVVPATIRLRTDFRDVEYESMNEIVDRARKSLARIERERDVETTIDRYRDQEPTPMSERCRTALEAGAERAGIGTMDLHSGGGHDTINIATVTDAALLFAPCRDGISHNPLEWTDWDEAAETTRVLAEAVGDLAIE
jgi:N-carbamoyl-L-amino-acid hydrolase